MNKLELAGYLCNLIAIMESREDAGIPRGVALGEEYERAYKEFRKLIDKELEDEKLGRSAAIDRSARRNETATASQSPPRPGYGSVGGDRAGSGASAGAGEAEGAATTSRVGSPSSVSANTNPERR